MLSDKALETGDSNTGYTGVWRTEEGRGKEKERKGEGSRPWEVTGREQAGQGVPGQEDSMRGSQK